MQTNRQCQKTDKGFPEKSGMRGARRQEGIRGHRRKPLEMADVSALLMAGMTACVSTHITYQKYTYRNLCDCVILIWQFTACQLHLIKQIKNHCTFGDIFETLNSQLIKKINC